jgi:hypothetical protein
MLVITHQKRTMEIADALYGVTMRDDGISDRDHQPDACATGHGAPVTWFEPAIFLGHTGTVTRR